MIGDSVSLPTVVERVAGAYLDGKPLPVGKKKLTKKERDSRFWASDVVKVCPPRAWDALSDLLARRLAAASSSSLKLKVTVRQSSL